MLTRSRAFAVSFAVATAITAQAAETDVLEEVVVTAQFREQRVQDTPIAISAISADMLEDKSASDIASAASLSPNVALARGAGGFGQMASIFIRGVGQADPHFAVEPGVGMYVDDVYYGVLTGAVFQLLDVDRVEILRGPQGTLSGKNSIGGSIKLFSKRPTDQTDGFAEVTYGESGRIQGRAAGNFTLVDDKLLARVSVAGKHVDGYVTRLDYGCANGAAASSVATGSSCKLGTQGGEDVWTARGSLLWRASDRVENVLSFDVIRDRSENPAAVQIQQSPLWAGTANYITGSESYTNYDNQVVRPRNPGTAHTPFFKPVTTPLSGSGIANVLTAELADNLQLKSVTGFRKSDVTFSTSADATPASINDQIWRLQHEQFTQELQLTGKHGTLLDWTAGLFYYDADGTSGGRVVISGGLQPLGGGLPFDIFFRDPVKTESKSAFLHTNWHPTEQLSATAALRYTKDSKKFTFNRLDIDGTAYPLLPGLFNFPVKYSGDRTDYRLGLDYRWSDTFMTYGQVSTGYKGGGVNPRPFFTTQAVPYDPEKLTAYEVGFKSQFLERRASLNVAAFLNKYKDFQSTLRSCPSLSPAPTAPCSQTTNVGDADIKGVEAEFAYRGAGGLILDLSAGMLDFEYTRINAATGITLSMTNVYTPDLQASAGVGYTFQLGDAGTLVPRLDYSFRSSVHTDAVNTDITQLGGRGLVDAKITWENPARSWEASVVLMNLTGKYYYESAFGLSAAPYFSSIARPGRSREWMLTVRRNFE